jgi:hypothetical protein
VNNQPRPDANWEGHNLPGLFPSSLYLAQLNDRQSDTIFFSVHPYLEQLNDSVFLMRFNFAPKPNDASNPQNYAISGNSGAGEKQFQIELADAHTVKFTFLKLGLLPALSHIQITVNGITSVQDYELNALKTAWFTEPDKRPVITSAYQEIMNDPGDFAIASTSKPGKIWLLALGKSSSTIQELESSVADGFGRVINANQANRDYPLMTQGLNPAFYAFYASDIDGRVSMRSANLVYVKKGVTTSLVNHHMNQFAVFANSGGIKIIPVEETRAYSAEVFDISGRLVQKINNASGDLFVDIGKKQGIFVVRIISDNQAGVAKVMVTP